MVSESQIEGNPCDVDTDEHDERTRASDGERRALQKFVDMILG